MGAKPESSRLNVLYILYVLSNFTDENHPMSIVQIKDKINIEFGYLSSVESIISLDTVKRTLEELTDKIFPAQRTDPAVEFRFGYYIHCVMKEGLEFTPYAAEEGKQPPKKYYYYESSLKTAELLMLKDAVETYSFFSEEDITGIIRKLIKLRPQSFPKGKYFDVSGKERDENSLLLMNIEDLNRIIQHKHSARINYCYYGRDKKLHPRPGYPKMIEPIRLLWSNGYYYLLAKVGKRRNITNLRIDRITDIAEVEIRVKSQPEEFNPVAYRHEHPVMFAGNAKTIVLLCRDTGKNYIMNTIIDLFGKNVHVTAAPDEMVKQYVHCDLDENAAEEVTWLKVTLEAAPGGVMMWATQYCSDCFVVSPEELREKIGKRLREGIHFYE